MIGRNTQNQDGEQLTVYGAAWCEDTTRIRRLLNQWGIPYEYIDIDDNAAARRKIARWNQGWTLTPTVTVGRLESPRLFQPEDAELHAMVYECGFTRIGPLLL